MSKLQVHAASEGIQDSTGFLSIRTRGVQPMTPAVASVVRGPLASQRSEVRVLSPRPFDLRGYRQAEFAALDVKLRVPAASRE